MNILFVLEHYAPYVGGVETLFKKLCEGLVKRGYKVTVVTSRLKNTKKFEVINGVNVNRVYAPNRYLFTIFSIPKVLMLSNSYDLIHTSTYSGAFPTFIAAKIYNKKTLITIHEVLGKTFNDLPGMNFLSAKLHQLF